MSRTAERPKSHVLSFRVEEAELKLLRKLSQTRGADISTLLRQGLQEVLRQGRP